jgi:hypothetical protein
MTHIRENLRCKAGQCHLVSLLHARLLLFAPGVAGS